MQIVAVVSTMRPVLTLMTRRSVPVIPPALVRRGEGTVPGDDSRSETARVGGRGTARSLDRARDDGETAQRERARGVQALDFSPRSDYSPEPG